MRKAIRNETMNFPVKIEGHNLVYVYKIVNGKKTLIRVENGATGATIGAAVHQAS